MRDLKTLDKLIMKYLLVLTVIITFLLNLNNIGNFIRLVTSILMPIIIGFALAYVVNILMDFFEKYLFNYWKHPVVQKIKRPISIALAYVLIAFVVYIVMSLIIPQLYHVIIEILKIIPYILESLRVWLENNEELLPQVTKMIEGADVQIEQIVQNTLKVANNFTSNILGATLTTVGTAFGVIVNAVLAFMISLYVLMSKEKLSNQFNRAFKVFVTGKWYGRWIKIMEVLDDSFRHFITGEVIEAFILGTMVTLGMLLFRFPFAPMIGALTGFTALIPLIGAYISGIVGFLLIFVQSPFQGVMFLLFIIVVQQLEGNLIYPKVVGDSIGLPGLWVLISITIGGGLMGVVGMLLAVPVASAFYRLLKSYVLEAEKEEVQSEFSDRTGEVDFLDHDL